MITLKNIIACIILLMLFQSKVSLAQSKEVPFTLEDRDRMIRIEEKLNSQQQQINDLKEGTRLQINDLKEGMQLQINDLKTQMGEIKILFYWGFGILFSLQLFILGYMVWDRRTAITPVREKTYALSENYQRLISILKEYSKKQPELAEILKTNGLL